MATAGQSSHGDGLDAVPTRPGNLLARLPREIRDDIYTILSRLPTVRRGFGPGDNTRLNLLQTCKQFYAEAKPILDLAVTDLHFRSIAVMVDYLTVLRNEQVRNIRNIRVRNYPLAVYSSTYSPQGATHHYDIYFLGDSMALFPSLQLDRLVVEDCFDEGPSRKTYGDESTSFSLVDMVNCKQWNELHYITSSTRFVDMETRYLEMESFPEHIEQMLVVADRNGSTSPRPSVQMFVAKAPFVAGMAENPDTRSVYTIANITENLSRRAYEDNPPSNEREVMIMCQRNMAPINANSTGPYGQKLIREVNLLSWWAVRHGGRLGDTENDPGSHLFLHGAVGLRDRQMAVRQQ